MKIPLTEIRSIIKEVFDERVKSSKPYDSYFLDDASLKKKSVYVPDDIKEKISSWAKKMHLTRANERLAYVVYLLRRSILMRLRISDLQNEVKKALVEEKDIDALYNEFKRVFGSTFIAEGKLAVVAERANDYADTFKRTGNSAKLEQFKPSVLLKFKRSNIAEVRKFVAKVLPKKFLHELSNDKDLVVRMIVAERVDIPVLNKMIKEHPHDESLRSVLRTRFVNEKKNNKLSEKEFDLYGDGRLEDKISTPEYELTDAWYKTTANELIDKYSKNLERNWEEKIVDRFVSGYRNTNGVQIDARKLYDEICDQLEAKDEYSERKYSLKDIVKSLKESAEEETQTLVESTNSVSSLTEVMNVVHSNVKIDVIHEQRTVTVNVPAGCRFNNVEYIGLTEEKALDRFCEMWSRKRQLVESCVKLSWTIGDRDNEVEFYLVKK